MPYLVAFAATLIVEVAVAAPVLVRLGAPRAVVGPLVANATSHPLVFALLPALGWSPARTAPGLAVVELAIVGYEGWVLARACAVDAWFALRLSGATNVASLTVGLVLLAAF